MIKIIVTLNDKKAKKDLQRLNEIDLIDRDKDAIAFLTKEFKAFLNNESEPMKTTNEECGLTITWSK